MTERSKPRQRCAAKQDRNGTLSIKEKSLDRVTEKEPRLYHDWIGKYRILFPSSWAISFKLFIGFSSECWHDLKILYDPVSSPFQHTQLMHRTPILPVHRKNLFTLRNHTSPHTFLWRSVYASMRARRIWVPRWREERRTCLSVLAFLTSSAASVRMSSMWQGLVM